MSRFRMPLACAASLVVAACSSSTTPAVEGLDTPTQVSIVTASEEEGLGGGAVVSGANPTSFPAAADYNTDPVSTWVYDPSIEPIDQVNEILCMMSQTRAGRMVNRDTYLAQIDLARCEQGSQGGGEGQSSGVEQDFQIWTVQSTRTSNTAAQDVSVWVPSDSDDIPNALIYVDVEVTDGISAANPFGEFNLAYAMDGDTDHSDAFTFGTLATLDADAGSIGFSFYEEGGAEPVVATGDFFQTTAVAVTMSPDQTSGQALVSRSFEGNFGSGNFTEDDEFAVAFDDTHLLRQKTGETAVCLSRENFETKVWRYNLYYADGADIGNRVELNSGFGFKTADEDYGWIGYHGLWVPDDVTIDNGDTITQDVWGEENPAQYTVFQAPGKLVEYSRDEVDLMEIEGQPLEWWGAHPTPSDPYNQYRVVFNGSIWTVVAVLDDSGGGYDWDPVDPPEPLDTATNQYMGFWSTSLGGNVQFTHGDDFVTVYAERTITGADELFTGTSSVTLHGFLDCLDSAISEVDAEAGDVYLPDTTLGSPYVFTFAQSDLTLMRDTDDNGSGDVVVGLDTGVEPDDGPFTWGLRTGPLVTAADAAGLSSLSDLWDLERYYVYETGHNDWNRFTGVRDSLGDFVVFDAPLQFFYTHATANDRNDDATFDGQSFFFDYNGPGNLHGIPHEGTDTDGDGFEDRWYPQFSIADGVAVGPIDPETMQPMYVLKATEMEQTLAPAPGECGALTLPVAGVDLTLPDGSDYVAPNIGAKPVVTDPPAVVDGQVLVTE